ncbi:MAG TPA: trypsin-like peptidase domain-containing protein [Pyrinomonadaceae bacterium]
MVAIQTILDALKTTREEFGRLFLQAQAQVGIGAYDRKNFEAIALSLPDRAAYETALRYAQAQGWFDTLVNLIIEANLQNGSLTRAIAESHAGVGGAALQAMTNLANGYSNPDIVYKGYGDGIRWTGKIIVDGVASGTGILIGPHLVLTAWHVVKALFTPGADGEWVLAPNGSRRLQVAFDDFLALISGTLQQPDPQIVETHEDWCFLFSACHPSELSGQLPDDHAQLQGYWDYAVIKLKAAPGLTRRWASLDARSVVPRANEGIFLFQHPAMQPLKVDQNFITDLDPPEPAVIPKLRFLHYANTNHGSSGGPCFDKSFMLFGFHQGVWTGATGDGRVTNRGVPVLRVIEHINANSEGLPPLDPEENPMWSLGEAKNNEPVIGTETFQKLVWRAAVAGTPKVLVIGGTPGSGKTFLVQLLSAMLSDGGHLKLTLKADAISKLDARQLADTICKAAGTTLPPLVEPDDADTTGSAWLKDEVVDKVLGALEKARQGRLVWLLFTELNHSEIKEKDASELLFLLYEQALKVDWLRIVLDGMRADVPRSLREVTKTHLVTTIRREDIQKYFERLRAERNLPLAPVAMSRLVLSEYERELRQNPEKAMELLVDEVMKVVIAHLDDDE